MPGVSKIYHKGKDILFVDYEGTKNDEEMIEILNQAKYQIMEDDKEYLQLTNMTKSYATPNFMKNAKQVAKETPKLAKKRAIVGVDSPGRRILLEGYNLVIGKGGIKPFKTMEEAKDWLVK